MVRGDQRVARECYSASMKQKSVDNIYVDKLDMHDEANTRPEPSEELEPVQLDGDPEHLAYIGSKLAEDLRHLLIHFLKQNKDVFTWKQEHMGGIDPAIITHRLNVSPSFKPVKQKRRSFAPEKQKVINEEVGKLLQAGAIREVEYPEWLANVVLVKKANVKWQLYINFTDVRAGNQAGRAKLGWAKNGPGQKWAGPKLAQFFRTKILIVQSVLKTGLVGAK